MDFEVTLPPLAQTIQPVMIVSPTSHCGTAMLQRAMCCSGNAVCYGDNVFEELLSIVEWATSLIEAHHERREPAEESLAAALERKPKKWMPDLAPEFKLHMSSIFSTIYNIPHTAQQFATENGYDVWGMIRNDMPPPLLADLLSVFPSGKAILIHRNPFDAARDLLRDHPQADLTDFCKTWSLGMDGYLKIRHERLIKLRYEDAEMIADAFIEKLAAATGSTGMTAESLEAGSESETTSGRELTDNERNLIAINCANMLAVYYPDLS